MQVTITLPDSLATHFQDQITTGAYATVSDYIQALIQADQARKAQLETKLLAALASPATPMTATDWDHIRTTVRQNLSQSNPNA